MSKSRSQPSTLPQPREMDFAKNASDGGQLGPYELVRRIASGGMAEVYLARRGGARGFSKHVALKRILPQYAQDPEFVAMFVDEARVSARLEHPNLVGVFDFGDEGGELFMAMEWVEGTTCAKLVRRASARGESVPVENCLHIILSVLRGLAYAHDARDEAGRPLNLVHRDVSPGNMLLAKTGVVKLGDFGIVRSNDVEHRTEQGQLKGKLGYMSPEQVVGRELDARSDLFTVGIALAEMLTGYPLFTGGAELDILFRIRDADLSAYTQRAQGVPRELSDIVYRALARSRADRYQTAGEFVAALEHYVRRHRMAISPQRLGAYLQHLELISPTQKTGEFNQPIHSASPVRAADTKDDEGVRRKAIYQLRYPDGRDSLAMTLAQVLEAFVTAQAPAGTQISKRGGEFLNAKEYPEFRRLVSSSAFRWEPATWLSGARAFPIRRATLPAALFDIALAGETGVLYLQSGEHKKKLYFVDGRITYTSSTMRKEMLGERLVEMGLVLPFELDMALALAPKHGGKLGEALVQLGVLKPMELFRALVEQSVARVGQVMEWTEGEIAFARGARSHEETLPFPVPVFEVLTHGIRNSYGRSAELANLMGRYRDEIPTRRPLSLSSPLLLRMNATEQAVFNALDGRATVADLCRELERRGIARETEVLLTLFVAASAQMVQLSGFETLSLRGRRRKQRGPASR